MDSVEATQELHGFKMELIETEVMGLKRKVNNLQIKDREILDDFNKLNGKVIELGISATSSTSLKVSYKKLAMLCSIKKPKFIIFVQSLSKSNHKLIKGIPTSCSDLQRLGHSFNGFYSVKKFQPDIQGVKIETVYCDFQSPIDSKGNIIIYLPVLQLHCFKSLIYDYCRV